MGGFRMPNTGSGPDTEQPPLGGCWGSLWEQPSQHLPGGERSWVKLME